MPASPEPALSSGEAAASGEPVEAAFTKDVRICVTQGGDTVADIAPLKWSKGPGLTLDEVGLRGCFESDNVWGRTGVNFVFDGPPVIMLGQNKAMQRPDILLCGKTSTLAGSSPDCADPIYGKNTFSVDDTFTMDATGHFFTVTRTEDADGFINFSVTLVK